MSALFLADGRGAALVGVSRQIVRALGPRPYVFRGCIGPVALPSAAHRELAAMLDALVVDFGLRGLNGLDFLLEGERLAVLELNPRPSASMDLYRGTLPHGLVRAHVAAAAGRLPAVQATLAGIRGFEVVYASHRSRLADPAALACHDWCHDRPTAPLELGWGEPVCTVSAAGATAAEVEAQLAARRRQIRSLLELVHE
jgi:predicted ATP-grasp superfamily ATP-dependent carboligase